MKLTATTLLLVSLASATAVADPAGSTASAAQLAAEAAKLYAATSYLEAGNRFDKAYALDQTLSYLFNAAQAYRLAKSCALSAARYERFLDAAPKDAQNLDKVRLYLEEERACAKDQQLAPVPTPVPVAPPIVPAVVAPVTPLPQPVQPEEHRRGWMRPTGIGVAAVGVVLVAFGAYEAHTVSTENSEHQGCDTNRGSCSVVRANQIDSDGQAASRNLTLGFSVGAAALVGGGVLYYLGRDPERASIVPTAGGAVVTFGGRF